MLEENKQSNVMTPVQFQTFSNFLLEQTGILFTEPKKIRLENRLTKRMEKIGVNNYDKYYDYLIKSNDKNELQELYDNLTVNETRFFRNPDHFKALEQHILPKLLKRNKKNIYIWSAASSTGEEPYSIAMTIDWVLTKFGYKQSNVLKHPAHIYPENMYFLHVNPTEIKNDSMMIQLLATDLSKQVIEIAKKGEYGINRVRDIPPEYLKTYFTKNNDMFRIKDYIKQKIVFKLINLKKSLFPYNFDIIFLRNVIMYFSDEQRAKVLDKIYESLIDDGYLFLGDAETIGVYSSNFVVEKIGGALVYRKVVASSRIFNK